MRILVDGYNLGLAESTGVATYARAFLTAARHLGHVPTVLYGGDSGRDALVEQRLGVRGPLHRIARLVGAVRATAGFSAELVTATGPGVEQPALYAPGLFPHAIGAFRWLRHFSTLANPGMDLAHWTFPLPVRLAGAANIYTIHDLIPVLQPELTTMAAAPFARRLHAVAGRADHLLTISSASADDIVRHLGVSGSRLTVTGLPHDIDPGRIAEIDRSMPARVQRLTGLEPGGYFVFAGAIEPKKNVGRLLEAYFGSGVSRPLVLAGGDGWLSARELAPLHDRAGSAEAARVIRTGFIDRSDLLALIRGARAMLFPSLAEGFGLPVIEAMALGTPVLTSHAGGLADAAGDAALIVDPRAIPAIRAGIAALDRDDAACRDLSTAGLAQAARFSAAAYAARLQPVLDRFAR